VVSMPLALGHVRGEDDPRELVPRPCRRIPTLNRLRLLRHGQSIHYTSSCRAMSKYIFHPRGRKRSLSIRLRQTAGDAIRELLFIQSMSSIFHFHVVFPKSA
jgi:hypothetical protein